MGELYLISKSDLVARCRLLKGQAQYVPSQCILHFVRKSSVAKDEILFEQLFKILAERVRRSLPRVENPDGKTVSFTKSQVVEQVYDKFVKLLMEERLEYVERLDFFEVDFKGALAMLKLSAQGKAWKEENRSTEVDASDDSGEIDAEVEEAAGSYDPFNPSVIDDYIYRSSLEVAMEELSPLQNRIIEMLRQEIPIDSIDPNVVTMAKVLGKSEKTIRTHRDKAFAKLRVSLTGGK
ncbi:MAG: DNA-binding response regulator [Pseudomonadota bacterium]